ncbi:hypothetical protein O181_077278 [Austropuccinia psidii MF-1]|uniref:Uncharacterized protein n=1 Tax=Austropuccinia psidii MF-1 TaxID=1389203 RepID=A0A9Q3IDK3_9BASI|nr:hypothetical protein [Austropuccinia psidii MF-1]
MPIQHSLPSRKTRSQARAQTVLTPTPIVPLYETPKVPQLRAHLRKEEGQEDQDLLQEFSELSLACQRPLSKVLVKMVKKRNSLKILRLFLHLWALLKVLEDQV